MPGRFTDVDGDAVVLRKSKGGSVDFYVNRKIQLSQARVLVKGNSLEITGTVPAEMESTSGAEKRASNDWISRKYLVKSIGLSYHLCATGGNVYP